MFTLFGCCCGGGGCTCIEGKDGDCVFAAVMVVVAEVMVVDFLCSGEGVGVGVGDNNKNEQRFQLN